MVRSKQPKYRQKEHLNTFGTYVQEICDRLGVSWEQIARKAEIDPSTLHYWCTGKEPNPKPEMLMKLYSAFKECDGWIDTYKQHLFVLGGRSTEELQDESKRYVEYLKLTNKVKYPDRLAQERSSKAENQQEGR